MNQGFIKASDLPTKFEIPSTYQGSIRGKVLIKTHSFVQIQIPGSSDFYPLTLKLKPSDRIKIK